MPELFTKTMDFKMLYDFPKRIEIELVSDCNLRCTYCPRHYVNDLTGYMDLVLFKRLIDEIAGYPDRVIVLHRRGESLMHLILSKCVIMLVINLRRLR